MKFKKVLLVLMILGFGVILASCKSKQDDSSVTVPFAEEINEGLPAWYVNNITRDFEPEGSISYTSSRVLTGFDFASIIQGPYFRVGKVNEFGETRYGVYDIERAEMVINANYASINYYNEYYFSLHSNYKEIFVRLTDDLGRMALYSLTARSFAVSFTEADWIYYYVNYSDQTITIEISLDGEETEEVKYYEFDIETNTLTFVSAPEETDDLGNVGQIGGPEKYPLDEVGFAGYSISYGSDKISMYYNDVFKYSIHLPIDFIDETFFIGSYFYFQFVYELPEEATEYDFFYGGQKYQVLMYRFKIDEGILREVNDVDFVISDNHGPLKDENDRYSYARLEVNRIWNKMLGPERIVLVNENLEIVHILDDYLADVSTLTKIDNDTYYSYNGYSLKLYDKNFVEKFRLNSIQSVSFLKINGQVYIQGRINYFGVIDLEGNIMIPFAYQYKMTFDGITARTVRNQYSGFYENPMLNKQVRELADDEDYIGDHFIEKIIIDEETGDITIKYYDLSNNLLLTVPEDYVLNEFYEIYGEHTGLADGYFISFYNSGENKRMFYYIKVVR